MLKPWRDGSACSNSPTCSKSVKSRYPDSRPNTRSAILLSCQICAQNSVTPWLISVVSHWLRSFCTSASSSSVATAIFSALQPKNQVRAAARARVGSVGSSRAANNSCHCWHASESKTLAPRATTAGIPLATSSLCIVTASLLRCTKTAISAGRKVR